LKSEGAIFLHLEGRTMKREILEFLICPTCLPEECPLTPEHCQGPGSEISEGILRCSGCGRAYPIEKGVARLAPVISTEDRDFENHSSAPAHRRASGPFNPEQQLSDTCPPTSVYESPEVLSTYLWSHYADLFNDPDANRAYSEWAELMAPSSGAALDAGCAVGRFCFEMSCKYDFAIGVDLSENFIHTARRIMEERGFSFRLKEEGRIQSERTFVLPQRWDSKKVEFLVADANALPFRSGAFSCVASLNLLDKTARPLDHLYEAGRSASCSKARMLVSDPFSWSETACSPDRWLGGAPGGRFSGFGIENVSALLSGQIDLHSPGDCFSGWKVTERGSVWWKIRNHRNHFEFIRSQFVKAER
jgi:SAM-dependent methyltransferase/uncharacterized protein YbaR (Trm112 family)